MVWKDGSTFCGQWKQGKMDGHGIKSDSLSVVKGKFRNGEYFISNTTTNHNLP